MEKLDFEQGPIRPPSEARSLLIRLTRNCPWNKCLFCGVYKGTQFSRRSVKEIKEDIQTITRIMKELKELSWRLGSSGRVDDAVVTRVVHQPNHSHAYRNVAAWMYYQEYTVFLQDGNNLILPSEDLVEVLNFLRREIPQVTRITSYARAKTVSRKSLEELTAIRKAGLDRIHIGMESGSDAVLQLMKKGVTAAEQIEAGKKAKEAGMSVSEYWMPGLGGKSLSKENALETARVLKAMNPDYIRLRSLRIPQGIPLSEMVADGTFLPLTDDEMVEEIRLMIDHLEGITSTITSDHMMNLLEDINGILPQDKGRMLAGLDAYLHLSEEDRLIYRFGRRGGAYRSVQDMKDLVLRRKIEKLIEEVRTQRPEKGGIESFLTELGAQYI
ncbi:MAG: radical SAM protein [Deltaproteobacteria bacterium]|nr:radical SAM protein [Deltaproteobacteria bacterium]